jgi:hypothetical protein
MYPFTGAETMNKQRGRWLPGLGWLTLLMPTAAAGADEAVRLQEKFSVGYQYHVSSRTELSGSLTLPTEKDKPAPKPLTVSGDGALDYDERVLAVEKDGQVRQTMRIFRRVEIQRKVGDQSQESTIRPAVRRMVLLRHQNVEVPFSPDGPLTWGEIDLVRTDVFTPALVGMLPDKAVQIGDHWTASSAAVQELTDMERIEEGKLDCKLEQFTTVEKRRHARVAFTGTVRGINEDGPNKQQLEGYFYFDLESNHLSYLSLEGKSTLLDKDGKEVGRVQGRFVLTRQAHQRCKELTDEALKGVVLEPNADNTLLRYDNPELGVSFLHPRRWRVAGVSAAQVTLDSADGSGLMLTLEPLSRVPTAAVFLAESRDWLQKQKAKLLREDAPRQLQGRPQEVEHFALDVELKGQRQLLDYYVLKQTAGGATVVARLLPNDQVAVRKEVERIARSVTISPGAATKEPTPGKDGPKKN